MSHANLTARLACMHDLPALTELMRRAIAELQAGFLSVEQIAASHHVMGLDTQLVRDGTYFIVEHAGSAAGCGGWSFRATLYGGDQSMVARTPARLDSATDAAKIRAMYTHPDFARRGIGTRVLGLCEDAARAAGFTRVELMATAAGVPLYLRRGYGELEAMAPARIGAVEVPLVRMGKSLAIEA